MTQRIEARSRQIGRLPRLPADTLPVRREKLRAGLASSAFRNPEDTLRAPSVQNIRSMDSLRPLQPDVPVSRPPYQGIPSHTANTPTRISGPGERSYVSAGLNRNPSIDRAQDGRYPEPSHSATSRGPPLQIPSPAQNTNFMPFLSPHVRPSGSNTSYRASSSLDARRASDSQAPPSPQVQAFHQVQPAASSPESATLFRQPLTPSEVSAARTIAYENYTPTTPVSWRPRSESASAVYRSSSPLPSESRRASDGNLDDRSDTQLPYAHPNLSPEQQSWLSLPRSNRGDTSDTASVAGTVSSWYSESTVGARTVSVDGEEGDSNDTAKAGDHTSQLRAMLEGGEGSAGSPKSLEAEDEEEATLFLTGPLTPNLGHRPLIIHPSPSRPNLKVDTNPAIPARAGVTTPSDSATESESESRITRAKSFARPRDQPEKWNIRPEPEQLYEHLDNFFPKIDLDKPIVEGGPSTPSTPSVESPAPLESVPPPSIHPSRQPLTPTMSPRSPDQNRPLPPPLHPSRAVGLSDRRKSIRVVVDHKRRTIQRESRNMDVNRDVYAAKQDAKKLDRRKSSSMWGYRIQEVTPSKIVEGQVPTTIPESPFTDGKPGEKTTRCGECTDIPLSHSHLGEG